MYDYGLVTPGVPFDVTLFASDVDCLPLAGAEYGVYVAGVPHQVPVAGSTYISPSPDGVTFTYGLPSAPFLVAVTPPTG